MVPGSLTELIWHFAGYLHISQDYVAPRIKYDEIDHQDRTEDFRSPDVELASSPYQLPDINLVAVRASYKPISPHSDGDAPIKYLGQEGTNDVSAPSTSSSPWLPTHSLSPVDIDGGDISGLTIIHRILHVRTLPHVPQLPPLGEPQEPAYKIVYTPAGDDKIADLNQINVAEDRDKFSDGPPEYDALHPLADAQAVPDMIAAAKEFIPDLDTQPGTASETWMQTIIDHDEALKSGEGTTSQLAQGQYENGEFHAEISNEPRPEFTPPAPPERVDGDADPAQVAQLGANEVQNWALIADLDEAPSTLVVVGNYFETNAIYQANVLQNNDKIVDAGATKAPVESGGNTVDNVATLVEKQLVTQGILPSGQVGSLKVNVDFVDGDLVDVKALTQRNLLQDGDISIQTKFSAYAEVHSGEGEQSNVAKFADWGKHYDLIVVLGDYHSANIISQTNIVYDNDVIGVGSGAGSASSDVASVYSGQNSLANDATITKYGATTFAGITGGLSGIIDALGQKGDLSREAWSGIHGAATGTLNVLFVTGDYYDLNIISQVNVIADADLAVQMGLTDQETGFQWLSTGGNLAANHAEIVNAGGVYAQYLGGDFYADSVLVQANLISEGTETVTTDPTALVSELVAFVDQPENPTSDEVTWTKDFFTNQDTFGHVLT
ncbi:hypothetical protein [Microvirga flavescens]|uniref:hypothetical protein n=1 Tax=Microvirga flavescens TaxID=2249811 RepID=UPI000DD73ABE|nr:hypothetical protein [Microvirga flavescens]